MITKLLSKLNFKTVSVSRNSSLLTPLFIIILYLGGMSNTYGSNSIDPIDLNCNLTVNAGEDQSNCNIEEIILTANAANASDCSMIVSSYKITDSQTEVGCFTADPGVIFQKGGSCKGIDYIWRAGDDLFLNEYDNDTAKITGTVIDQNGRLGTVDINLSDKEHTGTTWNASCYLDGISGPETYYRSFYGTITADGVAVNVGTRFNAHYILANGAGFDSSQYGLGAWTGGDFGECTEWFGNLVPQTIDNSANSIDYVWSTADGTIISDANQQTITVNKAGTYKVTAKDCADCEAIDTVVVTELPGPTVNAGEDVTLCEEELVELTATSNDISECPGGCVYPIERVARCHNSSNVSDVWLNNITNSNKGFVTSSSEFKTYDDGIATYTAIASNGIDNIEVDITFSGYTTTAPYLSPKENNCDTYNTSDWVYWTNTSGTIKTEKHGTLIVSRAGPSMQMGNGADVTRTGFGASGWLTISGGDGFYTAGDVNIKLGDCDAFAAVTTVDYMWSTIDGNIVGDVNQKTISVDKIGTYTVSVSDCESCTGTDEVKVSLNPEVIANAGADVSICKDEEVELTATGGGTYLWSTGATTASIKVSPNAETMYTVTVTSAEGCEATDEVKVSLNPEVIANAGADVSICKGDEVELTATGGGTYLWSTGATTASIKVSPNAETMYTVTVTSAEGCEATDEVKVSLNPEVIANAGADVSICKGDEVVLTATGGGTYVWNTGATTASITVDPMVDTTYTVTVTSAEGCEATDEVLVTLNPEVIANAGADVSICKDEEVRLTATGGGTYLWSTGATTASIVVFSAADTVYTVTVTSAEGCEATDEVKVSLNPDVTANAGADVTICKGDEVLLTATGGGTYLWNTGATTATIKVSPTAETIYSVTVTSAEGCEATDEVKVNLNAEVIANAGADVTICTGEEVLLTATGNGTYLWSTGETTAAITVAPTTNMTYTVIVRSKEGCEATDEVFVSVDEKLVIGDFVWLDENENGLQDDGATGINDVKVTLYECNGTEVASTMTADNASGEAGAYSFEVCPDSGYYYVVFEDTPEMLEFTSINAGDDAQDSDANDNGRTQCFNVTTFDVPTIDAGLVEMCNIQIDAGDDVSICEDETIEITASLIDDTADCPAVCVYPIKEQDRCSGALGTYEIFLMSTTGNIADALFKTSEQKLERYADNTARYTATATNGMDVIQIDALYTGYTTSTPIGSPKENMCQDYDTSDWEYWTTWSGTVTSENHGVFNLTVKGAAFQMGVGADVMRTGLGASGWFYADGGDGFYVSGDVNVAIDPCVENSVNYTWTTEDGTIVGDANQKTITVSAPGTYVVEAVNCIDCFTTDTIVVSKDSCNNPVNLASPRMSSVYPVPVNSGGRLTIEFDLAKTESDTSELKAVSLKATVDFPDRQEDVSMLLYDMTGRVITIPRTFKIVNGKAIIYLDLDYIPSGKYILRAQGPNWSDAKNVLVR